MARAEDPDEFIVRALFTINPDGQISAWWVDRVASSEEEDAT